MPKIQDQVIEFDESGLVPWKTLLGEACEQSGFSRNGTAEMMRAFFKALAEQIRQGCWTELPAIGRIGYQEEMHYRHNKPAIEQYKKFGIVGFEPNQLLAKAVLDLPEKKKENTEKTRELIYQLKNPHND